MGEDDNDESETETELNEEYSKLNQLKTLYYYAKASAQGDQYAKLRIGDYYWFGMGIEKDIDRASELYREASNVRGNAQASFNVGYMHHFGIGAKKDLHLAKRFYDK